MDYVRICCPRCGSRDFAMGTGYSPCVCGECGNEFFTPDQMRLQHNSNRALGVFMFFVEGLFFLLGIIFLFVLPVLGIISIAIGALFVWLRRRAIKDSANKIQEVENAMRAFEDKDS